VHDERELERALAAGARIVGINNRDPRTLRVDLAVTERLAPKVPPGVVCVSESGIGDHRDTLRLRPLADAFLVGSSLMEAPDLDEAVRALLFGRVKICGLTRAADARAARAAGATHGGLVLWPGSKRALDLEAAARIRAGADLRWVGVFVDESEERVVTAARDLALDAVQLHGDEDARYLERLRPQLRCALWKAQRITEGSPAMRARDFSADRLLLDAHVPGVAGGSGRRFDWQHVRAHPERGELVVGGGIAEESAAEADALGAWALDLSSGVEQAPGDKDAAAMARLFAALRGGARHECGRATGS
jgi:indole-3-glycerol phosphate synthase/phosphoribosylanthranilate isomerase